MSAKPRIGFFSGTFDPVHTGHVEFVLAAIEQFKLEKVLMLPEELPREKDAVTPFTQRLDMLRIAVQHHSKIELVTLATKRFSVAQTLPLLRSLEPGADLVFLCGSDVVKTFVYRWEGLDELLAEVQLIIGLRRSETEELVTHIMKNLSLPSTWHVMPAPRHHLASTIVRQGKHTIEDIHPGVARYIKENNLYS